MMGENSSGKHSTCIPLSVIPPKTKSLSFADVKPKLLLPTGNSPLTLLGACSVHVNKIGSNSYKSLKSPARHDVVFQYYNHLPRVPNTVHCWNTITMVPCTPTPLNAKSFPAADANPKAHLAEGMSPSTVPLRMVHSKLLGLNIYNSLLIPVQHIVNFKISGIWCDDCLKNRRVTWINTQSTI